MAQYDNQSLFSILKGWLGLYFLLAIGITWSFWIPTLILSTQNGYFVPSILTFNLIFEQGFRDESHVIIFFINQLGVYGPIIAAFIVFGLSKRKDDAVDTLKQMIKVKIRSKWYLFAFLIPLIISFASLGLSFATGGDISTAFSPGMNILLIFLMFFNTLFTSGLEEPGWRGYALNELHAHFPAYKSSIILGVFWSIWHYPFLVYLYIIQLGMIPFLAVLSMAGYTALITFGSVLFSWLYFNTKSLFLLILFHGLQNFIPQFLLSGIVDPLGGFTTALVSVLLVIIISKKYGEETLMGLTEVDLEKRKQKKEKKNK